MFRAFQLALRKEIQTNVGESAAISLQFYYDSPSNMLAISTTQATHTAITKWLENEVMLVGHFYFSLQKQCCNIRQLSTQRLKMSLAHTQGKQLEQRIDH